MNYFMPVEAQIKLCNYKSHRYKKKAIVLFLSVSMATKSVTCHVCVCVCEFLSFSGR